MGELLDAAVLAAPAQGHIELGDVGHLVLILLGNAAKLGHDNPNIAVLLHKGLGQGARHVAQAAGLHEGDGLKGGKKYA